MAKENEINKINELISTAGNSFSAAIIGKILFYIILYLSYGLLFFTLNYQIFKLNFAGNYFTFTLLTVFMFVSMSAISVLIGSFFTKKIYALVLISFTSYPLFFFAGYSWPTFCYAKICSVIFIYNTHNTLYASN